MPQSLQWMYPYRDALNSIGGALCPDPPIEEHQALIPIGGALCPDHFTDRLCVLIPTEEH